MKRVRIVVCLTVVILALAASADTFGTGVNQLTIDFVPISGSTNPTSGYGIVNNDYCMGTYEITNGQWTKFQASYGTVTGSPSIAYDGVQESGYTGTDMAANTLSWYAVAQFINYLNTSTGHQVAYKFTGTQGTSNYTYVAWEPGDVGYISSNPYRSSNAYYFLPTEDEWVKAAYWNGTGLQSYATVGDSIPINYVDSARMGGNLWDVGSGSEELNGTFDMMGSILEWTESPLSNNNYGASSSRSIRGGSCWSFELVEVCSSYRRDSIYNSPDRDDQIMGFRVASVPEPATVLLMSVGGLFLRNKRIL